MLPAITRSNGIAERIPPRSARVESLPEKLLQPLSRLVPITLYGADRDTERIGGLLLGQTGEEPTFDDPRLPLVHACELDERIIQLDELPRLRELGLTHQLERNRRRA